MSISGIMLMTMILCIPAYLWAVAIVDVLRNEFTGSNKIIWLIVTILVPVIGTVLYAIIGRKQKVMPTDGALPKKIGPTLLIALIIVMPVGGVFGMISYSSMKQFEIQQMRSHNATAMSDLRNAAACINVYYYDNGRYPSKLSDSGFKQSEQVSIEYELSQDGNEFNIFTHHLKGNTEYGIDSGDPRIFSRKRGSTDEWLYL